MKNLFKFGIVAMMAAMVLAFTGCSDDSDDPTTPPKTHTHIFAAEWTSDDTHHWKECDCGDKSELAEHTLGDLFIENGSVVKKCSICEKNVSLGSVLKDGVNNFGSLYNEFQEALNRTGATTMTYDSSYNTIDSNVNKIVFGFLSDADVKNAISTLESTKQNIGVNPDTYYAYFNETEGIVYIVPADENSTSFIFNEHSSCMFSGYNKCTEIAGLGLVDTSNVTDMGGMFCGSRNLKTIYVADKDTFVPSGCKTKDESWSDEEMFQYCGTSELTTKTN